MLIGPFDSPALAGLGIVIAFIALAMGVFTPTPAQPGLYVFTSIPGSFDSSLHSLITMILTGEAKFCALGFDKEGDSDEPKIH